MKGETGSVKGETISANFWQGKCKFILAGGHVRASAGALAVHTALILAGGHVRASAGALAVHTALIPRACVSVCIRRAPSEVCSGLGKRRIDRSTSKRSSKKLQRAAITAFFLDRSLVVVHCDRS